ncbi:hypothetical protein F4677DRAFT_447571 [Hypoxylon crocopeplum]|nr:hypothetical protein F4677DRAFT_447571 [Hypoxylon crocopeplum]
MSTYFDQGPPSAISPVDSSNIDGLIDIIAEVETAAEDYDDRAESGTLTQAGADSLGRWLDDWVYQQHNGLSDSKPVPADEQDLGQKIDDALSALERALHIIEHAYGTCERNS